MVSDHQDIQSPSSNADACTNHVLTSSSVSGRYFSTHGSKPGAWLLLLLDPPAVAELLPPLLITTSMGDSCEVEPDDMT